MALITNEDEHTLHIFDATGRNRTCIQQQDLEATLWGPTYTWEVNSASYSPDGIYLAIARSDNITHVYDSRMLGRGPLYGFEHDTRINPPGGDMYGVIDAQWVEVAGALGLITGGADGTILYCSSQ